MEKLRRRDLVLKVATRVSLVVPPAAALIFIGYQVEGGVATSFTGAGLGAAFGAAGGAINSIGDASKELTTRTFF